MSKHCHVHECQHEVVKFCKSCRDIYCVSCKKTWEEPCTKTHYWTNTPLYWPYITYTSQSGCITRDINNMDISYTDTASSTSNVYDDGHKVTCSNHE